MAVVTELTNMHCEKAVPRSIPYRLADRGGLHLLVKPNGVKLWRWRYRFDGKEKQMALGKYPSVPLAQARLLHAQARVQLAAGTDPMAKRKEAKAQRRSERIAEGIAATYFTFEKLTRQWLAWWKKDKNQRYVDFVESRLEADVIPRIGNCRPEEITRMDLVALTQATDERGARDVARRNLQMICQIFDYGLDCGLVKSNPAAGIYPRHILSKATGKNFAHLEIQEVPELLCKMREYNGTGMTRLAMELLSLTFLRTGELIGGRWEEIDWKQKQWVIPAERMKMKQKHIVPLSIQALAILKRLQAISGSDKFLFPDYGGGLGTMSKNTILYALDRMGYKRRMTGHGWRAIASTYLHEQHFNHLHIETQLAHKGGAGDEVAGAYNYALYLEARAEMMQAWADALDRMREEGAGKISLVQTAA